MIFKIIFFLLILSAKEAVAYIDPGTGGMVISSIGSITSMIIAAIFGFLMAYFFKPLKRALLKIFWFLRRYKLISLILLVLIIILLFLSFKSEDKMKKKVLLLGIDALDPKVMDKLMEQGKLPNFKKLKEIGSYSRLETTIPPETPVAWSAVATGCNPGKYGIFDFINRDPETYSPKLNLARKKQGILKTKYESAMKGVPFWRITSENGIKTTVIRWPVTFPPEKINGNMLSGLGVVDLKGLLNSYRFYTSEDLNKKGDIAKKIIKVEKSGIIETELSGPRLVKDDELVDVEVPMKIKLEDNKAIISIDDFDYEVKINEWSDWIRVKFNVGFMRDISGVFRVYLISIEPEFNMYVTSVQIDPENPVFDITYPKEYGQELVDEIGLFYTLGMPEDTKAVTDGLIKKDILFEQIKQIEEERTKMFWCEFNRFDKGIFAFGFDAGDRLQHIFWSDKILEDDGFKIAKEIEEYYIEKDKFLGEVLDKIDNNTVLIIFSDHGFSSFEKAVDINAWLVENGYMGLFKEPGDAGELFEYVNWSKTKAYSLGFTSIYINLKGRESNETVENKEELVEEIINKLNQLTDPKTGKKVIKNLYKGNEIYSGEFVEEAPDIIIGFQEGYRMAWQTAIGGISSEIIINNNEEWTGDHLIDRSFVPGVIFANFKITKENPNLIDIAPTVLSTLNIDIPKNIDGKSLI